MFSLFLLSCCSPPVFAGTPESPKVLILDSYHPGEAWSDNELAGVLSGLRKTNPYLVPPIEHLDLKRFPGAGNGGLLKGYLAEKYKGKNLDVLIVLDNPALDFALKYRGKIFPAAPIVFAGINDFRPEMLKGAGAITGVTQNDDIEGTLRLALSLHPGTKRIFVVRDFTTSGRAMEEETRATLPAVAGKVEILYSPEEPFPDLKRRIETLPADSLVLLLTYVSDGTGRVFSREESTRLITDASRVPVYSIHEALLGFGIVGGYLIDGKEHGAQAAGMALRVLAGEPASAIPVEKGRSMPMFDHRALARFRIDERNLPVGSIVIHRPVSFYEQHRAFVLGLSAFLGLLFAAIVALSVAFLRARRAEESRRISEERFRVLCEQSPLGMSLIDREGRYEYVNPSFVSIFGYALQDVPTGMDWFRKAFPDPAHRTEAIRTWKEDLARSGLGEPRPRSYLVTCKDGGSKDIRFRPVSLSSGRQFVIYEDVTRERELEEQLHQSQKMEAVGRLAGGIAHDFNNLLTVINGYGELLLGRLEKDSPEYREIEEIKRAGERAAALTRQLLAFSRKQVLQPKVFDLNEVISRMEKMLCRLIGEDVVFRTVPGADLWNVKADPGQIEQVIMNLVVNARDAMPGGGKLTIETSNVLLDEEYSTKHHPVRPGPYVMLGVSDTGSGMDEETASKVFEPFFTTKEKGKGTGLGLATAYGIVKQSGGFIWVYSEPGKGSTFKVYLPPSGDRGGVLGEDVPLPGDLRGRGTILLVEDEEKIRKLAADILEKYGYTVLTAGDGDEALRIAGKHRGEIGLLLTDVVMPGMGGAELSRLLRDLRPGIHVLYVSGYTDNAIVHRGVLDPGIAFLQKPYSPVSLARKVKEVMETRS